MTSKAQGHPPARPHSIRAMNQTLLLSLIGDHGLVSRADLARMCSLSKTTVALALVNLERAGLIRTSGVRAGLPGPAAVLYEVVPESGLVLGLDVGRRYVRGAISDFSGAIRCRSSIRVHSTGGHALLADLMLLADGLCAEIGVARADISQTVLGSPGVHDPARDILSLAGKLTGWGSQLLEELRKAFGSSLMIENDVDAAALA